MKIHEHLLRVDIVRRGEVREIPAIEKRTLTAEGYGKMCSGAKSTETDGQHSGTKEVTRP